MTLPFVTLTHCVVTIWLILVVFVFMIYISYHLCDLDTLLCHHLTDTCCFRVYDLYILLFVTLTHCIVAIWLILVVFPVYDLYILLFVTLTHCVVAIWLILVVFLVYDPYILPFVTLTHCVVTVWLILVVFLVDAVVGQMHKFIADILHGRGVSVNERTQKPYYTYMSNKTAYFKNKIFYFYKWF